MVFVGMMDGFIVLDEGTKSNNQTKFPKVIKGAQPITGSRPKLPEEVISSGEKLNGNSKKPTTTKLPQLMASLTQPSGRPYYPYGSHPYPFQTVGFGYNPFYQPQTNYGARPHAPQTGYGSNPYVSVIDNLNYFPPSQMFYRPSNGFQPYGADDFNQDAMFKHSNID
jgi:hypothetical protein